jgi:HAD superfamily hydrolase (TIGR01484 family)
VKQIKQLPRAVLFDLDDTLSYSYQAPSSELVRCLDELISNVPVAIVSGASFPRIEEHLLGVFTSHLSTGQLFVFANNASQCYLFKNGSWELEYEAILTKKERTIIKNAVRTSATELGIWRSQHQVRNILDRQTKIVFLGVDSDISNTERTQWDPDMRKRRALKSALEERLEGFEILIGGTHTIDITRKGINKAYAVQWLSKHLNVPAEDMLFIGDALYEGGNDAVVIPTGIATLQVSNPTETLGVIQKLNRFSSRQSRGHYHWI